MTPDVRRVVVWAAGLLVAAAGYSGEYEEEKAVTLIVPPTAFESEAHAWTPTKHTTTVTCDADGKLVLNGDVNWRNVALPMVMEGKIKEIKQRRRDGYTLLVISGRPPGVDYDEYFRFQIGTSCKDWTTSMDEIAVLTSTSLDGYGAAVAERLTPYYQWHADQVFVGDLGNVDRDLQIEMISVAHSLEPTVGFFSEVFRDEVYVGIDLGTSGVVYNTNQVNQNQRVAREITNRVFPILKELAPTIRDAGGFEINVKLAVGYGYQGFLQQSSAPSYDQVSLYLDPNRVILFAEYEITTQALIDAAVVLVNDNRVEVDLTEQ
jgi:hypothetical protein